MTLEEAKKEINKNQSSPTIACNRDYDSGWEDAIFKVIEILEQVDTVPVPKDTMTLKELAHELRKLFRFKYLTVDEDFRNDNKTTIAIWKDRPEFNQWNEWEMGLIPCNGCFDVEMLNIAEALDLSEYKDADGNVDYSRCIVEVE